MLIFSIFSLLFSNALTLTKEKAIFYSRTTILTLITTCFICYTNLHVMNLEKGIGLYGGIFNISSLTQSFNIFIFLITSIVLVYNSFYHRTLFAGGNPSTKEKGQLSNLVHLAESEASNLEQYKIIEYPLIILFIICGAVFLMTSGDLISLFISIELQSYGLYILSTVHRDSEQATWGGLTYFLLGGLSSCFILLGSSLLYINTGTTSLDGIYIITSITDMAFNIDSGLASALDTDLNNTFNYSALPLNVLNWHYINISLILLCVGFLFKISAAPFHFWSPDVYDAIPTVVTTTVAIIAKLSIFVVLLELVYYIANDLSLYSWKNCLLISSLFSLIIGSVLGLTQYRIKRVYAYSTISHVGFILLALSVDSTESIQAYIFYILSYTISNLNAFIILVTIGYTMYLYVYNDDKVKNQELEANKLLEIISNKTKSIKTLLLPLETSVQGGASKDKSTYLNVNLGTIEKTKAEIKNLNSTIESSKLNIGADLYNKSLENTDLLLNTGAIALKDVKYSPVQLVNQLKGYFYINSYLALSLAITLFSFIGIPPLIGFFAKQMVLSAALDNGYIFITLVGILTSVIGAVYYLNIVKQMFFFKSDYVVNPFLKASSINSNISISSALSVVISIMTLLLLLFIFIPNESFNLAKILTLCLFN